MTDKTDRANISIRPENLQSFEGDVIIITGGSSGIGLATAQLFLSRGAKVVNLDRATPSSFQHANFETIITDVASWTSQLNAFKQTLSTHRKLDVVYANAGIAEGEMALADKTDPSSGDPIEPAWSTIKINLIGQLITLKLAIHYLKANPNGGSIILCASRGGYAGYAMPVYTATKHGTIGLLRGTWRHTAQWNITVNAIAPSFTLTGLTTESKRLFEEANIRWQTGDDVAPAVLYLAQDKSLNGRCISISQGKYRELEGALEELRAEIYGVDDFEPKNEKEVAAVLSTQVTIW
ncbi:uncharacterized protein A1O5_06211 [Cladophialophora psammophila CBS 110553]|uniref:NAD(P)-binding protein n=1 Tax=Cladophialophora psammophila CBS 110553 TaxID=1182543 RepID=W9WQE0_9EURO|nr:uncharacterized protein A1O5_06211 [Cladophialophora psammophila CBS 110553]EXJ70143.1 hypothetical protein A1O5_06211 [Cladophialophora psammophila CBS 110553]